MSPTWPTCLKMPLRSTNPLATGILPQSKHGPFVLRVNGFQSEHWQWNVSKVFNMNHMFEMPRFNQPLEDWDVSGVVSMYRNLFSGATSFDKK